MKKSTFLKLAAAAVLSASALFSTSAVNAAPLPAPWTTSNVALTPGLDNQIVPNPQVGTVDVNVEGSIAGIRRSPWETYTPNGSGGYNATCDAACQASSYNSVRAFGSATYAFANGATNFRMMWGSPDNANGYNALTLCLDAACTSTLSLNGAQINSALLNPAAALGFVTVLLDPTIKFYKLILTANQNAFEHVFSVRQSANPVPLPGAAWLLLTALGGLGAVRRFRSKAA